MKVSSPEKKEEDEEWETFQTPMQKNALRKESNFEQKVNTLHERRKESYNERASEDWGDYTNDSSSHKI